MDYTDDELARAARVMKADALPIMHEFVRRVSAHDSALGGEAARYLRTFERRMPWAAPKDGAEGRARRVGPLPKGERVFGRFVVLPAKEDSSVHANWYPTMMDLVVYSFFDPRSYLATSILFHELFHAHDARTQDPANLTPAANGSFPAETDAWNFQSRLLDALVAGRFLEEIQAAADGISNGKRRFIRHGEAHVPELSSSFLRIFSDHRPPDFCVNTLLNQVQYELAKEFVRRSASDATEVEQKLAMVYTRLHTPVTKPISSVDKEFIRCFIEQW